MTVISGSLGYYFTIHLPNIQSQRLELERQEYAEKMEQEKIKKAEELLEKEAMERENEKQSQIKLSRYDAQCRASIRQQVTDNMNKIADDCKAASDIEGCFSQFLSIIYPMEPDGKTVSKAHINKRISECVQSKIEQDL